PCLADVAEKVARFPPATAKPGYAAPLPAGSTMPPPRRRRLPMSLKRSRDSLARPLNPVTRRLFQWDQRRLRHGQGRGFCHLEPLRPVHPVRNPLVDRVEELVDEDVGRDLLQYSAVGVDEADVAAASDPEVRVARLPRSVD